MLVNGKHYRTVWMEKGVVKLINQPLIPHSFEIVSFKDYRATAVAIKEMVVRGAGAIGAAAGFGMAQAVLSAPENSFSEYVNEAADCIKNTRPTAQNLFYAVEKVLAAVKNCSDVNKARGIAVKTAQATADEDAIACKRIGEYGEKLIKDGSCVSTHCNAGWLAFVDWGTALSPVYAAVRTGKKVFVYVDETRPRCQGSRLTAWELTQEKVPHAVIADNATGHYMKTGKIGLVIVGSDRIAANGDVANKIGTYSSAVVASENGIPFYVAAPTSTIDINCASGDDIPIEERSANEVHYMWGWSSNNKFGKVRITPKTSIAKNPAFDITPAKYISGIITEKGVVEASRKGIRSLFNAKNK
jgi:S-methyl-5-thioribose-1-phosphate isomerase